jgi:very-short-patch-repair endonuclease
VKDDFSLSRSFRPPSPVKGEGSGASVPPSPFTGEGGAQRRERVSKQIIHERAKSLRRNQTPQEKALWQELRAHRFSGLKFRRQQPFDHYIVDFVCHEKKLIIELDGSQHANDTEAEYDRQREAYIARSGYRILRFWNQEFERTRVNVLETIYAALTNPSPGAARHPLP